MRNIIKMICMFVSYAAINIACCTAQAATPNYINGVRVTQDWNPGWDIRNATLNYTASNVVWTYNNTTHNLTVSYYLYGATAASQFAVGASLYNCSSSLATFGQYKANWSCGSATRQSVTANKQDIDLGVVQTDNSGNGLYETTITGIAPGTYRIQYWVRKGVGCGFGNDTNCSIIFQAGGSYGSYYTITVN